MAIKPPRKSKGIAPPTAKATDPLSLLGTTDIKVLDGKATVTVNCDLKLSRNYQSGGASCGFSFVTSAEEAESSADAALEHVRKLVIRHMKGVSEAVEDLG